ncbi:MAG: hypothetical protein KF820_06185 [Candidatus Paracaedibacteraceae bacterium]|jgi:hypothetical protein|nr:hypothetical protein [Candidatus Paracaedibacteraceae bacterium]
MSYLLSSGDFDMTQDQAINNLNKIYHAAEADSDYALAVRTIELMCRLGGLFEKKDSPIKISALTDDQIQDLINQLS